MSRPPIITFLSDYGLQDEFVGVCHLVIAGICPGARVIDLSHAVPRHDVRAGALTLQAAVPYSPPGVQLAVVDPDVGAQRRAVALRTADERLMVGPDNGLLSLAAERCGGVIEAVDISASSLRLEPVSATFHGRDIFAPVAAHLAAGASLHDAGSPCDPAELVRIDLSEPRIEADTIFAHAVLIDRFGNVALDLTHELLDGSGLKLGRQVCVSTGAGGAREAQFARTFADVPAGGLLLYEDAQRRLALAVSQGDAAAELGLGPGDELRLRPA